MRIAPLIASFLVASTLVGCGGEEDPADPIQAAASNPQNIDVAPGEPSDGSPAPPSVVYKILSRDALEQALLEIDDLPPGYSQDEAAPDDGTRKTFCDYKEAAKEKYRVNRAFTKGGGLSSEYVSVYLRQYGSTEEARTAWEAMTDALGTCKSEVFEGSKLSYARMSAPKLGDASIGVRIEGEGVTLLQNFVLVGPVLMSVGGGGLMNSDADAVAGLLKAQVDRYVAAAGG